MYVLSIGFVNKATLFCFDLRGPNSSKEVRDGGVEHSCLPWSAFCADLYVVAFSQTTLTSISKTARKAFDCQRRLTRPSSLFI